VLNSEGAHEVAHYAPMWSGLHQRVRPPVDIDAHPEFSRMLSQIPDSPELHFTPEQLAILSRVTRRPQARHIISHRSSIWFFGKRYYLTVFFGREKRNKKRLQDEGQLAVRNVGIAYGAMAILTALPVTFIAIIGLYIIKCALGFDLIEGPSIMHEFVFGR
jgi:hypothetical protein